MQTTELKPLMERLAPFKVIGAQREEAAYQVAIQDIHWSEPGEVHVHSGRHCLIELAEAPDQRLPGRARYSIQMDDERECAVGQLNFLLPETERTVRWSAGNRHAVVCLMDPQRMGLLAIELHRHCAAGRRLQWGPSACRMLHRTAPRAPHQRSACTITFNVTKSTHDPVFQVQGHAGTV